MTSLKRLGYFSVFSVEQEVTKGSSKHLGKSGLLEREREREV